MKLNALMLVYLQYIKIVLTVEMRSTVAMVLAV